VPPATKHAAKLPAARSDAKAAKPTRPAFAVERNDPKKGGGFDPYNSR
jgi:hypothetical protein